MFTTPDTQTVVVTFTKREEKFERVMICVDTEAETDLVDEVIVAHSEEWYREDTSNEHYAEFAESAAEPAKILGSSFKDEGVKGKFRDVHSYSILWGSWNGFKDAIVHLP